MTTRLEKQVKESQLAKDNATISELMEFNYKCTSVDHYIQQMNEDGTPYSPDGTSNKDVTVWSFWNPHREWSDLMPVVTRINEIEMSEFNYDPVRMSEFRSKREYIMIPSCTRGNCNGCPKNTKP